MPDYMSSTEVAAVFGVHRFTVVRWADRGLLSSHRTSTGVWQFDRAEVAGFTPPKRGASRQRGVCSTGCGRAHHANGLCRPHYRRWWRTGDARPDVPFRRPEQVTGRGVRITARPVSERRPFDLDDTGEL